MAKAQGKKATAAGKNAVKKVAERVKSAAGSTKKKVVPTKTAPITKSAAKKPAAAAKPAKTAKAPAKGAAQKGKAAAKTVKSASKAAVTKVAKAAPKKPAPKPAPKAALKAVPKSAKPALKVPEKGSPKAAAKPGKAPANVAGKSAEKPAAKAAPKAAAKPAGKPVLKAVPPPAAKGPVAVPPPPAARAPEPEKKRGRRARPRVLSSGAPAAAWLSTEKPRPASFIPAPARAEAPSAIAAPPASSDRLLRPEDVAHPAVRTVPIRIDVEQSAGRYYVLANPMEVTVRVGEGIEWDFRYLGGADVSVDEIVIEFDKPSPFAQTVFRTRKPGGARPHRQLSDGALPSAAGKRIQYTVRANTPFKTELANTRIWVTITA